MNIGARRFNQAHYAKSQVLLVSFLNFLCGKFKFRNDCYRLSGNDHLILLEHKRYRMNIMQLFGLKSRKQRITEAVAEGAIVVDVRTPAEFKTGHIKGSINVPLDQVGSKIEFLRKKDKTVITCCRSGMRSGSAAMSLKSSGIKALNGGSWQGLSRSMKAR